MFRGHTCSLRLLKLFNFKIFGVPQKPTPGLKTGNYEKKNVLDFASSLKILFCLPEIYYRLLRPRQLFKS